MILWNKIYLAGIFAIICYAPSTGHAQHILQEEPSMEIRAMARETSQMFTKELGLTEKQKILMEKEIIAYATKKEELLKSKMREEAKAQRLLAIQHQENGAMRNILTKPQYERYLVLQHKLLDEQLKKRE